MAWPADPWQPADPTRRRRYGLRTSRGARQHAVGTGPPG
jgi:hypothetical protein